VSQRTRSLAWTPPNYEVDDQGRVVGYKNRHRPNNWGRWGADDQRGTANLLTPERVAEAARLIVTGQVISCALPLGGRAPVHGTRSPVLHLFSYSGTDMVSGATLARRFPGYQGSDDYLILPVQGSTQWDGLAHIGFDDCIYNGFWLGNVEGHAGAKRCGIDHLSESLIGRGVLLDLCRHQGVPRLEQGHAISPQELDACAHDQGVTLNDGDIILIRTGHLPWWYELRDKSEFWRGAPGLSIDCAEWAAGADIAALAMDNLGVEVEPFPEGEQVFPLHVRLIRDLGLTLGEMWWLEDLAEACASDRRYAFFISAPPLKIAGGAGSMINPVAIR
jgi:kynurenine formamidase